MIERRYMKSIVRNALHAAYVRGFEHAKFDAMDRAQNSEMFEAMLVNGYDEDYAVGCLMTRLDMAHGYELGEDKVLEEAK